MQGGSVHSFVSFSLLCKRAVEKGLEEIGPRLCELSTEEEFSPSNNEGRKWMQQVAKMFWGLHEGMFSLAELCDCEWATLIAVINAMGWVIPPL